MQTICKQVEAAQLLEEYAQLWKQADVQLPLTVTGGSMWPFLASGRDTVYLRRPNGALRCGDIALYRAERGQYILHRVCAVEQAGYSLCGDAQTVPERGVSHERVLAVAVGAYRRGRYIAPGNFLWEVYARPLRGLRSLHRLIFWAHSRLKWPKKR